MRLKNERIANVPARARLLHRSPRRRRRSQFPFGQCAVMPNFPWAWRMGISGQGESSTAEAKGLRHGVVQELCSHALRQFLIDEREGHLLRVGRACDRHAPLVGARLAFGEDLDLSPGPLSYLFDT